MKMSANILFFSVLTVALALVDAQNSLLFTEGDTEVFYECMVQNKFVKLLDEDADAEDLYRAMKCSWACYFKKFGVMTSINKIDYDRTVELLIKLDEIEKKDALNIVDNCKDELYKYDDECDAADYLTNCMQRLALQIGNK